MAHAAVLHAAVPPPAIHTLDLTFNDYFLYADLRR